MKKTIIAALLIATSTTAMASTDDFTKVMRQLAAHDEFEVGYFSGNNSPPYVLHNGKPIDIDKAIHFYQAEKEVERLALLKEHNIKVAAEKVEKARVEAAIEAAKQKAIIDAFRIAQAKKHGIKADKLEHIDTPFSDLPKFEQYELAYSYTLRVSAANEMSGEIHHLADLALSGEVTHAVYGKDEYSDNKTVKLSALIDFENSNIGEFTINVNHAGLWAMEDVKSPNYTQRLYALNDNLPTEKSTIQLVPGEHIETSSVERHRIIYSLIKK
jgi:ribosomal protein L21